ncbi:DUF4012 domain-containing protein [Candidatus Daviesbacteria bacterium]|nr:DUF4012 domain-containing protein [Candidatus Daviesbacteria bacterium]
MALINLNKKLNNFDRTRVGINQSTKKKRSKRVLIILAILVVAILLPGLGIYTSAKQLAKGGKIVAAAAKQNNLDQIKVGLDSTSQALSHLNLSLDFLFWMRAIPFVGGYYADVKHITLAAKSEIKVAQVVVGELEPVKNELGLTGQPTPGQDKVAQAVKILDKILPNVDKFEPDMKKASDEVASINTGKYPEEFASKKIRSKVEQLKNFIIGADMAVSFNRDALQIAPGALGSPSPKTYLMIFQNDKEIRPTGGFMTAYAFLQLDQGHLSATTSDDIYRLDEKLLSTCKSKICPLSPPAPIVKYLPETNGKPRTAWSMRDSNISPDLPTSAKEFERMYFLLGEGLPFDGIITIDTQVVEELIALTGPVNVEGTTYSAEKDKRCNCPNVIYELEHYAEIASKGEMDRKAILGSLMQQILAKSLNSGFDKLPGFIDLAVKMANDKHLMFYMHDQPSQQALAKLNWTGQIKTSDGDYLHINDANFAGGKSNLYVNEKVILDSKVDNSGQITNKLTIEYKNPQAYNTWLNGILRDYVRVYVPKGAKLTSSKGSDDPVNTLDDETLNKTYFEAFITVRPQNSRTLSFEYTLPNQARGKNYPLLIQKQPGAKDHHYIVKVNGKTKAEFDLTSDKQLNLSF